MPTNLSALEILERHVALPRRQRIRIEKLLTSGEQAALREFRELSQRGQKRDIREHSARQFSRCSPRLALILRELVDENLKVKVGILAPATRESVQNWVDKLAGQPHSQSSQLISVDLISRRIRQSLSQFGLGLLNQGRRL